ncbi:MAG: dUTP diphosphatase [bacterium]
MLKLKIKKLNEDAVIPTYAKDGDACFDLIATGIQVTNKQLVYSTGLAMEIPKGYVGLVYPRSSISKYSLSLCNSVGVIDSGYRGEIMLKFNIIDNGIHTLYNIGDRIGQMMILPIPSITLDVVDELSDSDRGTGGFGSTGI